MNHSEQQDFQSLIDKHVNNGELSELKDLLNYTEAQGKSAKLITERTTTKQKANSSAQGNVISKIAKYSLVAAFSASLLIATEELRSYLIIVMIIASNVVIVKSLFELFSVRADMHTLQSEHSNAISLDDIYTRQIEMIKSGISKITATLLGEKREQVKS